MTRTLLSALLLAPLAAAQPPQADDTVTFRSSTQLVVQAVSVTSKSGRPLTGLTAADFTITEDGVPQTVSFCEFQPLHEPAPASGTTPLSIDIEHPAPAAANGRRLLVLYFDLSSMPPGDQLRAQSAAYAFVAHRLSPADLVAVVSFSDSLRIRQTFTSDQARLLAALRSLLLDRTPPWAPGLAQSSPDEPGSTFGDDDPEFSLFTTDRQLAALQTLAPLLGRIPQKKALVYFASGLRLNGTANQAQLAATINAAVRANVALFPVDSRGLVATPPLGDASRNVEAGLSAYTGAAALALAGDLQLSQDTLFALAAGTAGKALTDNNDLSAGIANAQRSISSYYLLGYYTTNTSANGRYRRIRIALNAPHSATLDYRQGYYADKHFQQFTAADRERQLQDALALPDPVTEITINAEINWFQLNSAEYFVSIALKLPGRELALARRRGHQRTSIDFIGEIKDEYRVTLANVRDRVDLKLGAETAVQLARKPILYDTGFTLLPGLYTLKLLARDNETGRIGTYLTTFEIPNLRREQRRLRMSSVVLAAQRQEAGEGLFQAAKPRQAAANPLLQQGRKLVPSVTRSYRNAAPLFVFAQTYPEPSAPSAPSPQPQLAYAALYNDSAPAWQSPAYALPPPPPGRLPTSTLLLELHPAPLPPGTYTFQLTVIDPATRKTAFWRTPVAILP